MTDKDMSQPLASLNCEACAGTGIARDPDPMWGDACPYCDGAGDHEEPGYLMSYGGEPMEADDE